MSGGKYFEFSIIYYALDIVVPQNKSLRSHNINLVPWRAYEIVLLKSIFDSKIDAAGDDTSSSYYNMSPPTDNMTLNGSDFSGRQSHTKFTFVTVQPLVTSPFMINSMVFFALTRLSIPLASLLSSFPTYFY